MTQNTSFDRPDRWCANDNIVAGTGDHDKNRYAGGPQDHLLSVNAISPLLVRDSHAKPAGAWSTKSYLKYEFVPTEYPCSFRLSSRETQTSTNPSNTLYDTLFPIENKANSKKLLNMLWPSMNGFRKPRVEVPRMAVGKKKKNKHPAQKYLLAAAGSLCALSNWLTDTCRRDGPSLNLLLVTSNVDFHPAPPALLYRFDK